MMAKSFWSAPRKSSWSPEPLRGSVFWLLAEVTRFRTTSPAPKNKGNMVLSGDSFACELCSPEEPSSLDCWVIINSTSHTGHLRVTHRYSLTEPGMIGPCLAYRKFLLSPQKLTKLTSRVPNGIYFRRGSYIPFFGLSSCFLGINTGEVYNLLTQISWEDFSLSYQIARLISIAPVRHTEQHLFQWTCAQCYSLESKVQHWSVCKKF